MKRFTLILSLLLLFCVFAGAKTAQAAVDFREETIYFLMTTRFFDGDASNNRPNEWCSYDPSNPNRQITDPDDVTWRGDFKGLIQKLDYIKDLGFTAIWITPIVQNRGPLDYHGYHAWDFTKVDPRLESPGATFQDLINEVHARGMKIVLDVVFNHSGRFGIKDQCEIKYNTDPTKTWGQDKNGNTLQPNPNWQYDGLTPNPDDGKIWSRANVARMPAPYNSDLSAFNWPSKESFVDTTDPNWYHQSGNGFAQGWDDTENLYNRALAGDCPDLNTESDQVRNYMVAAYTKFINMGVDAFRVDTVKHMERSTVQYFVDKFKAVNPNLFIFGEVAQKRHELHNVEEINPHWYTWRGAVGSSQPSGMAVIDFYAQASMHNPIEYGQSFSQIKAADRYDHLYADPTYNLLWLDNHDFGPNNDWNKRYGGTPENLAACMNFMFTWRGIPIVYYGTEIQFMRGAYADIHEASDIEKSLNLTGRAYYGDQFDNAPNHRIYQHIKKLNAIRKAVPALQKGSYSWGGTGDGNGVGFIRESGSSYAIVGLAKDGNVNFNFSGVKNGTYRDAVTGSEINVSGGNISFNVDASSAGIYVLNGPGMIGAKGAGYFQGGSHTNSYTNSTSVTFSPESPVAGQSVTVTYDGFLKSRSSVTMHWGYDGWTGVVDSPMTKNGDGTWSVTVTVPQAAANTLDAVFFYNSEWDNNNSADYRATVVPWGNQDTVNPTVSFTSPAAGAVLKNQATVTVDASDNVGVTKVSLYAGAALLGEKTSAPYTFTFDTKTIGNGSKTLKAVALDAAGNRGEATLNVTVDNDITAPAVTVTLDKSAASISGTLQITVNATDASGIATITASTGSGSLGTKTSSPALFTFDSTSVANGSLTLTVTAVDTVGNTAATNILLTINNQSTVTRTVHYYTTRAAGSIFCRTKIDSAAWTAFPGQKMVSTKANWYTWTGTGVRGTLYAGFFTSRGSRDDNGGSGFAVVSNVAWVKNGTVHYSDPDQPVDNPPVLSSITVPAAPLSGTITLSADASDDKGVAKVAFYIGSTLIAEDASAPFSVSFNTKTVANATHTFKAVVTDTAGQTAEKSVDRAVNNIPVTSRIIHYKTSWPQAYIHYKTLSWTTAPGEQMTPEGSGWFVKTISFDGSVEFVFNDGNGTWDNNSDQNYLTSYPEIWVEDGKISTINPTNSNTNGNSVSVTIHYKSSWSTANVHYNNGNGWTASPGETMEQYRDGWFRRTVTRSADSLTFVFNNGSGTWDNNGGGDFTTAMTNFWVDGSSITDTDPVGPQPPKVSVSAQGYYTGDKIDVTLTAKGDDVTGGKYTTDGSDPAVNGIAFTSGTVISIGSGVPLNTTNTLRLYATSAHGTDSRTFTYIKVDKIPTAAFSWDNATVYFVLTDRFKDGNPANNNSYGRQSGTGTGDFHGGDLAGLTLKLNENYFSDLGVNVLWISCPLEQIHGWVVGKNNGFKHWAYHGYYIQDFTKLDANMGTEDELRTFIDTAHSKGIRVVFDIVLNHPGYNTHADMNNYQFGTLHSGWENADVNNYHDFIDYNANTWTSWWGPQWIRSGLPGHDQPGGDALTESVGDLPDFKTENGNAVGLPVFYQHKSDTRAVYMANTSVSGYLISWVTDWVRRFGVDGFRVDTAKHVGLDVWKRLKDASVQALRDWKAANPTKKLDDLDFWMTAEAWGHGVGRSEYHNDGGFDSVINFSFQGAASGALDNLGNIEGTYSHYAGAINTDATFNVLSYLSSHDTKLFYSDYAHGDDNKQKRAGTLLLLAPGAVQIFYGDEVARQLGPDCTDQEQRTRSAMPWPGNSDVLTHWQKIGRFRNSHVAVGAGSHSKIADSPYTFSRIKDSDKVVCALGATGSVQVNVSTVFSDGTLVKDAYSGQTATVSGGSVTFTADANGVILIEAAQ